jgi:hypothetical protein
LVEQCTTKYCLIALVEIYQSLTQGVVGFLIVWSAVIHEDSIQLILLFVQVCDCSIPDAVSDRFRWVLCGARLADYAPITLQEKAEVYKHGNLSHGSYPTKKPLGSAALGSDSAGLLPEARCSSEL